jgi:hypothetical protein
VTGSLLRRLVVLTGPIASGKNATAEALVRRIAARGLRVVVAVSASVITPWLTSICRQRVPLSAITRANQPALSLGVRTCVSKSTWIRPKREDSP